MSYELQTPMLRWKFKEFCSYLNAVGYRPGTQNHIISGTWEFLERRELQGICNMQEITRTMILEHRQYLQERPNKRRAGKLSARMVEQHMYDIRVFFDWLEQSGEVRENPASGLFFARAPHTERQIVSVQEIKQMYEAASDRRARALLSLLYGCGLRHSEALALDAADIRYQDGFVHVRYGKGGKSRRVPMSHRVVYELQEYMHKQRCSLLLRGRDSEAFVLNNAGRRMRMPSVQRVLNRLIEATGNQELEQKRITPHCLRHSIATHLLEAGVGIEQIQDFLGHSSLDATQIYTRVRSAHLQSLGREQ